MCLQVPQRTTSISPALVRKNSPGNGPGLGPRAGAHLIRARYTHTFIVQSRVSEPDSCMNETSLCLCCHSNPDLRRIDFSMETPLKRTSSGSSSSSSTPSSQGGSNERGAHSHLFTAARVRTLHECYYRNQSKKCPQFPKSIYAFLNGKWLRMSFDFPMCVSR